MRGEPLGDPVPHGVRLRIAVQEQQGRPAAADKQVDFGAGGSYPARFKVGKQGHRRGRGARIRPIASSDQRFGLVPGDTHRHGGCDEIGPRLGVDRNSLGGPFCPRLALDFAGQQHRHTGAQRRRSLDPV